MDQIRGGGKEGLRTYLVADPTGLVQVGGDGASLHPGEGERESFVLVSGMPGTSRGLQRFPDLGRTTPDISSDNEGFGFFGGCFLVLGH